MKAIVITRPGGPDVLELREIPDPAFGAEEVLVRIRATAVNRADLLQRRGQYPAPPGSPADVPGLEFAGEVESSGERVANLRQGDRVMGILGGGGYAQRVALHERLCMRIPPALEFTEAAAIPEAFLTAYDALFHRGKMLPGESVLLHAAGSGVGTAAAQIARVAGGRVILLSRSAAKRRRLEEFGFDRVLDPAAGDLEERIRAAAGNGGVDLVVDLLGAAFWRLNVEVAARGGRIVLVGTLGGARVNADLGALMHKRITVIGTVLRARPVEEKMALVQDFARRMLPLLAVGRLRPVVDRVIPLEDAAAAHDVLERNENFGKVVLRVG